MSAAPIYQLWTLNDPIGLHLSRSHPTRTPGVVDHGRPKYPRHPWLPVLGLADVLIHALHCLPELEALVMVQSAVGAGDISLSISSTRAAMGAAMGVSGRFWTW